MKGAFKGLPPAKDTPDLLYIHTTGGRKPIEPREIKPGRGEERSVAEIVEEHRRRFEGMIARFAKGEAAYSRGRSRNMRGASPNTIIWRA